MAADEHWYIDEAVDEVLKGSAKVRVDTVMSEAARERGWDKMPLDTRAYDVPEIRQEMRETAGGLAMLADDNPLSANPDYSPDSMFWQWDYLTDADLYWVSPEMCELLQHAYPDMPPTTCVSNLLPSESGVVVFGRAIAGV